MADSPFAPSTIKGLDVDGVPPRTEPSTIQASIVESPLKTASCKSPGKAGPT